MKMPSREEQRYLAKLWLTTGPELERRRLADLRGKEYTPREIDSHLSLANFYDGPPRLTSGMVEMQRIFMKARKQG